MTTSSTRPPKGRRTLLIDRGFQLRYIALLAAMGGALTGSLGALMLWLQSDVRAVCEAALAPTSVEVRAHLSGLFGTMLWMVCAATVLSVVLMSVFGLLLTHRVAGPVHVMGRRLATIATGRYPAPRTLRRHDELKALYAVLNDAIESVRQRERAEVAELTQALAQLGAGEPQSAEALARLAALRDRKEEAVGMVAS